MGTPDPQGLPMLPSSPPSNTEIIQGQAGDILRSWQETTHHLCQDGTGCGICEEGEYWGGRLLSPDAPLLLQPSSAQQNQHPAKPGWITGWVLPSLGCPEQLSHPAAPPPLAAAPTEPLSLPRRWGGNAQRGPRLLQAHLGSSIWQGFHYSQLTSSNNSGINRARLAGCRNIIHLVSYCETFNY